MSMLPPPTPILPRLQGYVMEESLLLATVPMFDVDTTLDDADFLLPAPPHVSASAASTSDPSSSFTSSSSTPRIHLQEISVGAEDSPEAGRRPNTSLDLDSYLPSANDATLLQNTSLGEVSLPPLSPIDSPAYSPYARPGSALSWSSTSTSTAGPSRIHRDRTPLASPAVSLKRPADFTPHKDDFYSRRVSDANRRASFGTPSFSLAEREREDLRRAAARGSLRRSGSTASFASVPSSSPDDSFAVEYGREQGTPQSLRRRSTASLADKSVAMPTGDISPGPAIFAEEHVKSATESRTSTPAKIVGFFTGLLRRSNSSSLRIEQPEPEEPPEVADTSGVEISPDVQAPRLSMSFAPVLSRLPPQTSINAPPLRQPAPPKSAYPYVAPLTRPLGPKFATDARASRPVQKDAAPRPLAALAQNKVVGTSEFAKAALAKLPPPGRGARDAGEKVSVKPAEHARDFGKVKNVWERLAKENKPAAAEKLKPREMKRTIPVQGHTPGKASLARAKEREAREAVRRERRELAAASKL